MEATKVVEVLKGHESQETAYIVGDYPYGFKLRCKMRCWIETNKKGQRYCTQTTDPRITSMEMWNKPKVSTYSDVVVMFKDEKGHVHNDALSVISANADRIKAFVEKYESGFDDRAKKYIALANKLRERERDSVAKTLSSP